MKMKNKKTKIKKLKLPLNKMTGDEKNYTAVLLEDVNSNMKAFWEIISDNQNDIKILKEKSDATFEQLGFMTEKIGGMETRLDSIEFKLDDLISEISFIKEEILALKTSLSAKADKEKLEVLEFKIVRIEKYLKLAQ